MNNINTTQAQNAQSMLENCIIQLLIEYYKEHRTTAGATPAQISKTLGIFRGTNLIEGGMKMNDAIVTGLLQNLIIKKQVQKIEGSHGQYRLTDLCANSFNLV